MKLIFDSTLTKQMFLCLNLAEEEYDTLDYSRPGSSYRPQYQRMPTGMKSINIDERSNLRPRSPADVM
jgi:hypothetical protein